MITLSTKDADWIANVMRSRLKLLENDRNEKLKVFSYITNNADKFLPFADKENKTVKEYKQIKIETLKNINEIYTRERTEIEKILELMMAGSEGEENEI